MDNQENMDGPEAPAPVMGQEVVRSENIHVAKEQEEVRVAVGTDNPNFVFGVLGYILPFLFFLPLVTDARNDHFAKHHANQQLLLLLFWVIGSSVSAILIFVLIGVILMPLVTIVGLVYMIIGILNVMGGKLKPLPIIGRYFLIK